mgnify:CR=1 FL=1
MQVFLTKIITKIPALQDDKAGMNISLISYKLLLLTLA